MKKEVKITDRIISTASLASAKINVNSTCNWLFHQPKVPDGVKKLRKF